MYNPTRDQVRQFFFDTWKKYRDGAPLEGLEKTALGVVLEHPEYHGILDQPERHADKDYLPEQGETNPFLHMSLHLALEEQLSIDQPPGIKAEFERLLSIRGDRHEALHSALECLAELVWQSSRNSAPPSAETYLECLRRKS